MMRNPRGLFVPAVLLAAAAAPALGQVDPSRFALTVTPTLRGYTDNGDGTLSIQDFTSSPVIQLGLAAPLQRRIRVELRYKVDVVQSTAGSYTTPLGSIHSSAGLASVPLRVTFSRPFTGTVAPAPVGNNLNTNPGFANPDVVAGVSSGPRGLYPPFNAGTAFTDFGGINGQYVLNTVVSSIEPTALSSPDQFSTNTVRRWSVYAFDLFIPQTEQDGVLNLTVSRETDDSTGNPRPWSFYPRIDGAVGAPVVGTGGFTGATVSIQLFGGVPSGCPAAPPTPTVATSGCDGIQVSWAPVQGATGYTVARWLNGTTSAGSFTTTATTFLDTTAVPGASYRYAVQSLITPSAACEAGRGLYSGLSALVSLVGPPTFTGPAPSRSAVTGQNVSLAAPLDASATFTSIQWLRNGVPVANGGRFSGATTSTLAINPVRVDDTGEFSVRVTRGCGTSTSGAGVLGVSRGCAADFTETGGVDILDIFAYLEAWFAGCP